MSPPPTPNTAALHEKVKRCMLEVEQDLHRTCGEHPFFRSADGLRCLRRVLVAFAQRNTRIGYAQVLTLAPPFLTPLGEASL